MHGVALSVIVPTYNRPVELQLCLAGFAAQSVGRDQFEIIIVDDGSREDTEAVVSEFTESLNVEFIRAKHGGPGAARNIAIERARGPVLVLYDDDLRPASGLIEYCLNFHRYHPGEEDAALLYFVPDAAIERLPLVRWAFPRLYQFPRSAGIGGWRRFWSGTLTCKKSLFRHALFDPSYWMLEDAELALRLVRSVDLKVHFEPSVLGTYTRPLTFSQVCRRQYTFGYYSYILDRHYHGSVNYEFAPYDCPECYIIRDPSELAAMLASARALEKVSSSTASSNLLTAIWTRAEVHARASGWMAARDGCPSDAEAALHRAVCEPDSLRS